MSKKTRVLTIPRGTIKNKIIMKTITFIRREKASNQMLTSNLEAKWTYKTALGIAIESNNDEIYELICVVETHKIMPKNEKENKKGTDI